MELTQILEEISVGFNQADQKSKKLRVHTDEVRSVLEQDSALLEKRKFQFTYFDDKDQTGNQIFLQGSYAIHLAIKHRIYQVDADLGLYIDDYINVSVRERLYNLLVKEFSNRYTVVLKKPCITIDFRDGYKIDIALYSKSEMPSIVSYHNSILTAETKSAARPKQLVEYLKIYLQKNNLERPVLRLAKHFIKTASQTLKIPDNNNIPSVSINIIASQNFFPSDANITEATLSNNLKTFVRIITDYVNQHGYAGPNIPEFFTGNTFYKIDDISTVKRVLTEVSNKIEAKNYAGLVSHEVFDAISKKLNTDKTPSLVGTMGLWEK